MEAHTELRKLPPGVIYELGRILDVQEAWKKLMAMVPKNGILSGDCKTSKYTVEHIILIEQAGRNQNRPCAEIFLEEWGTSGRKRPDISFLIHLLGKAELFRAADFMTSLLKEPPLERPDVGPSAPIDVSYETLEKLVVKLPEKKLNGYFVPVDTDEINRIIDEITISDGSLPSVAELNRQIVIDRQEAGSSDQQQNVSREFSRTIASRALGEQETIPVDHLERHEPLHLETTLTQVDYAYLESITDYFNETPQNAGGRKLGTGGFGSVYLGIEPSKKHVAVKRLNKDAVNAEKQFRNEVESLSKFRHHNLLCLLGYSCNSDMYCVVYEYMSNGSLESRLACKDRQTDVLQWQTRLKIALGTAHGIQYLHTAFEKPLIHRDIKSANILLDEHLVPKIGDFGLVRLGQHHGNTTTLTTTVLGTSAYMAPEAFRGDVSVKLDTFSFGVVLLEILTGLPPYDEDREGHDLVTHVDAMCEDTGEIGILLDKRAGDWGIQYVAGNPQISSLADKLYAVACSCLEDSRVKRPTILVVVQRLEEILGIIT